MTKYDYWKVFSERHEGYSPQCREAFEAGWDAAVYEICGEEE